MAENDEIPFSFWKRVLHALPGGRRRILTGKDLQQLLEESEAEGVINEEESEMLHSIFTFGETIVREIMVPRTDMVCCAVEAEITEILAAVNQSGHSRIPIFEGSADRIVGIVYAKDLLKHWGTPSEKLTLKRVMREPYFVPETKNIEELLREFRSKRVHLAIAVDEYGGTSGLVTIEDLLEEIVGDIQDEFDREEAMLDLRPDGTVLVDARLGLEEFEEYFDVNVAREKIDSVGGYVCDLFGRVPAPEEEIVDAGLHLQVVESDMRTIRRVRVTPGHDEAEPESVAE